MCREHLTPRHSSLRFKEDGVGIVRAERTADRDACNLVP